MYCTAPINRAEQNGAQCVDETSNRNGTRESRAVVTRGKREIEREGAARQQQVLQQLRVRTEDREPDADRQASPRPRAAVSNGANEEPKHERQQRADVELSVMSGGGIRCDRPAEHVRESADQRAVESHTPSAQEQIGEAAGEEQVNDE